MHISQKFFWFGIFFICGVGVASFSSVSTRIIVCISGLIFSTGVLFGARLSLVLWCILFFLSGIFHYQNFEPQYTNNFISSYNNEKVEFIGQIYQEPDTRIDHTKLYVRAISSSKEIELNFRIQEENKYDENKTQPKITHGNILLKSNRFPRYEYGDVLHVTCKPQEPKNFDTFNYKNYLARYHIYSICYYPKIKIVRRGAGNKFIAALLKIKKSLSQQIQNNVHEPYASFLAGVVIGERRGIDPKLMEAFNATGTTHIIAVSGYNITIIVRIMFSVLLALYIRRQLAMWVIFCGLIIFVFLSGMSASVVRAAIMGSLVVYAQFAGRASSPRNILLTTVLGMVIINPKILIFDIGFQLSFCATIGLMYCTQYIEKFFKWVPQQFALQESLIATLTSTLITLPLIIFYFKRIAIHALVVNMLVLPGIPVTMLAGVITIIASYIYEPIAKICGWYAWLILEYIIQIIIYFAS